MPLPILSRLFLISYLFILSGCTVITPADLKDEPQVETPIRFLLSFDDGPSIQTDYDGRNPTNYILQQLKNNPFIKDIKAIFFVQTRNSNGGGTEQGKALLRKEHNQGHLLGVHSASPDGHVSHVNLTTSELDKFLKDGVNDLKEITGYQANFVRPTNWKYNQHSIEAYKNNNLKMMLTDISANDGVIHIFNISFRRRSHINNRLYEIRQKIINNKMPIVDGVIPVVITFHDPNTFTADHMTEYLQILVEEAKNVLLPLSDKPFYVKTDELKKALHHKAYKIN